MPSGLFIKDALTKHFKKDLSKVILYIDGINDQKDKNSLTVKKDGDVFIYFGDTKKTEKGSLFNHKNTFKNIINSVKNTKDDYRIFIFSAEIVKEFSHWIVLLVRNIGENKVETILLDSYVFNELIGKGTCTYSETDQTTFPGWLYQNCIREFFDDGTCPICWSEFSEENCSIILPCCNKIVCKNCCMGEVAKDEEEQIIGYICPMCKKILSSNYIKTLNPRYGVPIPLDGIEEPTDIPACNVSIMVTNIKEALNNEEQRKKINDDINTWLRETFYPSQINWESMVWVLMTVQQKNIDAKESLQNIIDKIHKVQQSLPQQSYNRYKDYVAVLYALARYGASLETIRNFSSLGKKDADFDKLLQAARKIYKVLIKPSILSLKASAPKPKTVDDTLKDTTEEIKKQFDEKN